MSLKCLLLSECTTNNAFFNRKQKQTKEEKKTSTFYEEEKMKKKKNNGSVNDRLNINDDTWFRFIQFVLFFIHHPFLLLVFLSLYNFHLKNNNNNNKKMFNFRFLKCFFIHLSASKLDNTLHITFVIEFYNQTFSSKLANIFVCQRMFLCSRARSASPNINDKSKVITIKMVTLSQCCNCVHRKKINNIRLSAN